MREMLIELRDFREEVRAQLGQLEKWSAVHEAEHETKQEQETQEKNRNAARTKLVFAVCGILFTAVNTLLPVLLHR